MFNNTLKLLIALNFIAAISLTAQTNFVDATIFKNNGDSVVGKIDYQEWFITPKIIAFKAGESQNIKNLSPSDISKFVIKSKNETYQSAIAEINKNDASRIEQSEVYNSISEAMDAFKLTRDTIFMVTMVKGAVSYYEFVDDKQVQHHFIQNGTEPYIELLNLKFSINVSGRTYRTSVYNYKTQLSNALNGCPNFGSNYRLLGFYESDIQKLVKNYNDCIGKLEFVRPKAKKKTDYYVFIGAVLPGAGVFDIPRFDRHIYGKFSPSIGAGLEFGSNRKYQPMKFGLEFSFSNLVYKSAFLYERSDNTLHHEAKLTGVHLTPFYKNNFYNKKNYSQSLFLKLGIDFAYYFNPTYTRYLTSPTTNFPIDDPQLKNSTLGFLIGGGINIKKIYTELRYEPWALELVDRKYSGTASTFSTTRLSLIVSYKFK